MSLFSPLLVICLDQDEVGYLSELSRALGYPDAHIIPGGFADAAKALALRTSSPSYILIDIGERGSDVLSELDEFALNCEPGVRVVVIGSVNDIVFYRELKSRGVLEYFPRPAQVADIRNVLLQSAARNETASASSQQGTVIALTSAASGDGSSTLAVNLAYCLAEKFKQPTVLVDMDYQFGLISKSLDLVSPFGIRELFDHPERGLDDMLVSKMLVKYSEHMSIISAPGELRPLPMVRPETIRELVNILRSRFAFVILDVPHIWTEWTAASLTYSNHTVMVAQLWLRSLTHATRLFMAWNAIGVNRTNVSLIVNRSGAKFKEAITTQDFERICHHKIDGFINNDVKAITKAENDAKTLFEVDSGILQQQIKDLAQSLVTRYAGAAPDGGAPQSFVKKGLLARIGKK
jgi:pilus assembly protein CpaE